MQEKFYKAWWWLTENHEWAIRHMHIDVVKVSPKSKRVLDDASKNTLVNYWIEAGPMEKQGKLSWVHVHDIDLDCGADTFEEAIIKLAKLVRKHYGEKSDWITGKKKKV